MSKIKVVSVSSHQAGFWAVDDKGRIWLYDSAPKSWEQMSNLPDEPTHPERAGGQNE